MQLSEDDESFSLSLSFSVLLELVSKAESKLKGKKKRKERAQTGPSGLIILIISPLSAFLKKRPLKDARLG